MAVSSRSDILDCHIHLWDNETYEYPFPPPELKKICKPFFVHDLEEAMKCSPVRQALFVQVNQTYVETDLILDVAKTNNTLVGVVGWVDLQDPHLDSILEKYQKHPKFKGVRHIVEAEPDDWLARQEVQRGLGMLEKRGLTYDLLIRERHFKLAKEVVSKFPKLTFIVDHIAKPDIKGGQCVEEWKAGIAELAKCPNVCCKISGMITEADHDKWTVNDIIPFVKHVLSVFGVDRCLYGSDWPVCYLATDSYNVVYESCLQAISHLSDDDKIKIFCTNATRIYNI
ncbi:uncharacterized protein LOC116290169 [Actinia tenebrosa]|uniref:Uncharacterized protein LOC116290169 n=1 Tax=Actinia tenebrosa TaxID=6105 RepID=A0A6P8HKA3_ACTTE|nr:uncharacterized protein LOC116290169 [Actinia tenebrosa]